MRRGQIDSTGRTVRNFFTNPGAETAGAAVTLRTNLAIAPNFEASSGTVTVRTNMMTNPSFETNTTSWSANTGTPTLASDSTHTYVGTKALKLTSTVSSADIAVLTTVTLNASTTYTLSYRVYSPDARTSSFDIAGTGWTPSGLGTVSVPANTWTQVYATFTTPSTSPGSTTFYLHNNGGPTTIGTSLWIDAVLLEASPLLQPYFDGATAAAGDFTYAWSGTANASTSYQQAPGVASWSNRWFSNNGGSGVFYKSATGGVTGSCGRKLFITAANGSPQDTGINPTAKVAVTGNTAYTFSGSVRASVSQNFTPYIIWYDASSTLISTTPISTYTNAPANTYTRVSVTATSPSNAAFADFIIGPYVNALAMPAGSYLDFDQVLIEASSIMDTYFDGASTADTDRAYAWTGTVNASNSIQTSHYAAGVSSQNCFVVQSSDWAANGSKSFRIIPGPTPTTDTSCNLNVALQNKTYTLMATCRVKAPQTGTPDALRARRIQLYYTGTGPSQSVQAPNAVGVYPLSVTFTVTDSTQYNSLRLYNGASAGNGDIWWDNVMLVEGAYSGDFINPGVTPFSKWDGAANASTSVGYPPQLTDFAGKPFTDVVGPGNSGGVAIPVSALGARTIYMVYDVFGTTQSYAAYGSYGLNGTKGLIFQTNVSGQTSMVLRADFPGGDSNKSITLSSARIPGQRFVVAIAFVQGMTSYKASLNGAADISATLNPGTGWDDGRLSASSVADGLGVRIFAFNTEHDFPTRQAISRYLGNKHSVGVA